VFAIAMIPAKPGTPAVLFDKIFCKKHCSVIKNHVYNCLSHNRTWIFCRGHS